MTVTPLIGESGGAYVRDDPPCWPLRYRLEVIGFAVDGLVSAAGGWLFDRVMAGWDVRVRVAEKCELLPLRILGASVVDVDSSGEPDEEYANARELAVDAETAARDGKIREILSTVLKRGYPTVTLWGDECSMTLGRRFRRTRYRPSGAARAFKAQALGATPFAFDAAGADEIFRRIK